MSMCRSIRQSAKRCSHENRNGFLGNRFWRAHSLVELSKWWTRWWFAKRLGQDVAKGEKSDANENRMIQIKWKWIPWLEIRKSFTYATSLDSRKIRWFLFKNTHRNLHLFKMCENGHCNLKFITNKMIWVHRERVQWIHFLLKLHFRELNHGRPTKSETKIWKGGKNDEKQKICWKMCLLNELVCNSPYITRNEKKVDNSF